MEWLFGRKKTPEEMMKENQRLLRRAMRSVCVSVSLPSFLPLPLSLTHALPLPPLLSFFAPLCVAGWLMIGIGILTESAQAWSDRRRRP